MSRVITLLLRHESPPVRAAVTEAIWQADAVEHLPALREAAEREQVESAREYMRHALGLLEAGERAKKDGGA